MNKRLKPWEVWYTPIHPQYKARRVGRFATRDQAQEWIERIERSYYVRRSSLAEEVIEAARMDAKRWAMRYSIKGPTL